MPQARDKADVFLTGTREVEQVEGAAIAQQEKNWSSPLLGRWTGLSLRSCVSGVSWNPPEQLIPAAQSVAAAAQQVLQTIEQPFVLILTCISGCHPEQGRPADAVSPVRRPPFRLACSPGLRSGCGSRCTRRLRLRLRSS